MGASRFRGERRAASCRRGAVDCWLSTVDLRAKRAALRTDDLEPEPGRFTCDDLERPLEGEAIGIRLLGA